MTTEALDLHGLPLRRRKNRSAVVASIVVEDIYPKMLPKISDFKKATAQAPVTSS